MNKFFNNISYKNKVFYFSSLLLTTSIVCPLASCSNDGTSNDIGGFDKEFGFDAQTYNRLERQFISKYGASLLDEKDIDNDAYINKINNFLQNDLTILRNKLFDPVQNYSFTVRTNTLMDYASKNYNIQLNRNANVSDIDFDNLKQSSLENFVIYMENIGFTNVEIDEEKAKFNKKFDEILENCKSKTSDNAQILMQLRADVIDCWADLDDEFAHMSAYNHLKNFFDKYEFVVRENNNNEILWDNLLKNPDFMGENNIGKIDQDINYIINETQINNLFTISKKSNESKKKEEKNILKNNNSKESFSAEEPNRYRENMIPGFILIPVLKTMSQNIYSNEYYMNIDWQLIHAKYQDKDQETKNKVTAHLATVKDEKVLDYTNFKDGQLPSDNYQFTRYSLKATLEYQQEKMIEAYFDQTKEPDQKITFSWNSDKIGIEYFLPSNAKSKDFTPAAGTYDVPMAESNLSSIGLQLNGTDLSDLLNKKTNFQDSQSAINTHNDDDLRIEEKFVKYCNINSDSIVSFSDNEISNNTIQSSFTVAFTNSNNIKYNVETKSNINNIKPSKIFSNNAVNFYKQVVNYVDSEKILENAESQQWLTNIVDIGLYLLLCMIALLVIWFIVRYKLYFYDGIRIRHINSFDISDDFHSTLYPLIGLSVQAMIIFLLWKYTVSDPIADEVAEINKWNKAITDAGTQSDSYNKKINVINKVYGDDKDNFKSVDSFMKYYEKDSNSAFESYFYYFHFVELSQNQSNNKQLTTIDEQVKTDYENFNLTKNGLNIGNRNFGRIIIGILSLYLIFYASWLVYDNYQLTRKVLTRRSSHIDHINNWRANINHNLNNVHHGLQQAGGQ